MIDIESQVFQNVATAFRTAYPDGFIASEYVAKPSKFPAAFVVEMSNTATRSTQDSGSLERHADVMYQVDIYSNRIKGKKAECRGAAEVIDAEFAKMGFTRTFLNPIPNMNDATIYRITARYIATVDPYNIIYRR